MTEQQLEVGVGQDAIQVSSPDPDDVVGALDNLLGGCLAGDGEQLLDNAELVTDVVRSARDCIAGLAGRGPSAEEADDKTGANRRGVNPNPPIHTGGRREDSGRV